MKKSSSFKILFFALVILTGIYALAFFYGERLLQHTKNTGKAEKKSEIVNTTVENKVCFLYSHQENPCFKVQIADTDEKRRKGLMFVEELPEDEGMLFTYDQEGSYTFWMKNTLIPLDMIWIDKNKEIVDIQIAQPCKTEQCPVYTPKGKAQYVLELNAEITKKYRIQTGQKLALTQIITNTFNTVPDQKNAYSGWIKFSKQYSDYTWRDEEAEGMCAFMIDIAARELEGIVEGWEKKNYFVIENEVSNDCTVEGYYSDDGKRQGTWISYYPNGKMHKKSQYKNNKRSGLQQEWYPNGNMRTEATIENDRAVGIYRHFYRDGSRESYTDRDKGILRTRYKNGNLRLENIYLGSGVQKHSSYYENGKKSGMTTHKVFEDGYGYWNGILHGIQKSWFQDGTLQYEVNWKKGKKHGTASLYAEDGTPIYEKQRDNGNPTGIRKKRDEKGNLIFEGSYNDRNF